MEEKKLKKKKERAEKASNTEALAEACNSLGDYFQHLGRYADAAKEFEQEYNHYQKLGKRLEMAKASRMIGEMYMFLCMFEDALKHIKIYLTIVKELNNQVEQQRAFATLGRAHLLHGQSENDKTIIVKSLKSAEKAFVKSLLISKELSGQITKLEQLDMQARLYLNIGVVQEHLENFKDALLYMNRAIKISKSNDNFELLHLSYLSVCLLYQYKRNDHTKALSYCNLALDVSERLPNKVTKICQTLIAKAEIVISIGDFEGAKEVLVKAFKMKTPDLNDHQNIEKSLKVVIAICNVFETIQTTAADNYEEKRKLFEKLGDGCCRLSNYEYAITYYLKTLECIEIIKKSDKEFIPIYVSLYQTYKDDKRYKEALEYLWKEFELNRDEPEEAFYTLCNIGEIFELQSETFWKLYEMYSKALEQARLSKKPSLMKVAYLRLMKIEKKFNMNTMLENLKDDAKKNGFDLDVPEEESDSETQQSEEHNTPDIGEDISLDEFLDSGSETEEKENSRSLRKRGTCFSLKRNNKGETQLHAACISGNIVLARHLIDQGHDVNARDYAGWLPLHEACNHGHKDLVELLLDRGAISAINDKGGTSCDGITPLYDACSNGYLEVAELLIDRGANTTLRTDFGDTALNALEKWRISVQLDFFEQKQYERVRFKLQETLLKLGFEKESSALTNDSIEKICDSPTKATKSFNDESELDLVNPEPTGIQFSVEKSQNKRNQAEIEYKAVMESLKRPNRSNDLIDDFDKTQKRRSAFLDPEETDDDWLDDDLLPKKKKRKTYKSPKNDNKLNEQKPQSLSKVNPKKDLSPYQDSIDAFSKLLDLSKARKEKIKAFRTKRPTSTFTFANFSTIQPKEQSTLLDNGFCRFQSKSSISNNDSTESDSSDTDSTLELNLPQSKVKTDTIVSSTVSSTVSFKIEVNNELLLVPVEKCKIQELSIGWLAQEASRRYYNLIGLKPILRLMTSDGYSFEETDSLSTALDQQMLTSKVIEWEIFPLSKRYQEVCAELKTDIDPVICSFLETGDFSKDLDLQNLSLTSNILEPLFKAIMHQSALHTLDLSNNFLQNEGCKMLAKSLPTLPQLKVLDLSSNFITYRGIVYITASAATNSAFQDLEQLTLNGNPIGNKSVRHLETLCRKAKNLQTLSISECSITSLQNFDLTYYKLNSLNVSFNKLDPDAVINILSKLNASNIKLLNLNYSFYDDTFVRQSVNKFLMNGSCGHLKRLDLAGCKLVDIDVYKLVQMLSKAPNFEELNLSDNPDLTFPVFPYILKHLRSLNVLLLGQCKNILTMQLLETIPLDVHVPQFLHLTLNEKYASKDALQRFWIERWGNDAGEICVFKDNVILYSKQYVRPDN